MRWIDTFLFVALASAASAQPVALIATAEGNVTLTHPGRQRQPAHALDWLNVGAIVETPDASRVVIAFQSGRRFELGARAKLTVASDAPSATTGPVRELEKIPRLPKLPEINALAGVSAMGGMRVRRLDSVRLISPQDKIIALPHRAVLRFDSADSTARHRIEIEDQAGAGIYQTETSAKEVVVPTGILHPGRIYRWKVRGMGGETLASASFRTASEETVARRNELAAAGPDARLILAAVDAQLGLLEEARAELRDNPSEAARKLLEAIDETLK